MRIPKDFKEYILREFNFVLERIPKETDARRKLYYFSAAYASLERLMRYSLDTELLLTHAVLNLCYNSLKTRLESITRGDALIEMPKDFDKKLVKYLTELKDEIENDKNTYETLGKFVHLAYQTSGAGYYTRNFLEASEAKGE
jgi:hypothetical protein